MTVMLSEATGQVMAERRGRMKDRPAYTCHGGCGETLRPWRRSVAQFPGTKMEYSANRCIGCWHVWMRQEEPDNPDHALTPCTTEECENITRPIREPLASAPGTLRRGKDHGRCAECTGPVAAKKSTEHTIAGLERFMSTMRSNAASVRRRGWQ